MSSNTNILLESGTNELEVVEFVVTYTDRFGKVSEQYFGVNVAKVREIIRMPELTKMPNLPDAVYGVFNLRGSIIPALDLKKFLYGEKVSSDDDKMIIAEFNKIKVGFIVNDVRRIHRLSWKEIVAPDSLQEFDPEKTSIVGIIQMNDRNVFMLDVEKIVVEIDPESALDSTTTEKMFDNKPIAVTAEDSSIIRKMISQRLNSAGFEIKAFNDGMEAWEELRKISEEVQNGANINDLVNIIITDIEMPKMDGYTLTKNIRNDSILKDLPVIIFSSIVSQDVLHKGKSVGASAQLTKPQIGELLDTVRILIDNQ